MTSEPLAVMDGGELIRLHPPQAAPSRTDPADRASWRWWSWPLVVLGLLTGTALAGVGALLAHGAAADAHLRAVGRPVAAICYQTSRFSMPRVRYSAGAAQWNADAPFAGPLECVGQLPMTILVDPADPFVVGTVDGEAARGRDDRNEAAVLGLATVVLGWALIGRLRDSVRLRRLLRTSAAVPLRLERTVRAGFVPRTTLVRFAPAPGGGAARVIGTVRRSSAHRHLEALEPGTLVQVLAAPGRALAISLPGIRPMLMQLPGSADDASRLVSATAQQRPARRRRAAAERRHTPPAGMG